MIEWIRFAISALLMFAGLAALFTTTFGIFRFKYVLNRIHVAAKCDTAGMTLCLGSLMVMNGFNMTSMRLFLLIVFVWISNPVAGHLVAYLEVATNPKIDEEFEVIRDDID
jgi:Multisubunit Na+/H+ antiporter, MnhG subunit